MAYTRIVSIVKEENLDCEGHQSAGGHEGMEMVRVGSSYTKFGCEFHTHKAAGEGGRTGEGVVLLHLKMVHTVLVLDFPLFTHRQPKQTNLPKGRVISVLATVVHLVHFLCCLTHSLNE